MWSSAVGEDNDAYSHCRNQIYFQQDGPDPKMPQVELLKPHSLGKLDHLLIYSNLKKTPLQETDLNVLVALDTMDPCEMAVYSYPFFHLDGEQAQDLNQNSLTSK
jgi:hypothetical protein